MENKENQQLVELGKQVAKGSDKRWIIAYPTESSPTDANWMELMVEIGERYHKFYKRMRFTWNNTKGWEFKLKLQ